MGIPKSVIKIKKSGVEYVSSVDRVKYTIRELTRAALRDTGKYICSLFRRRYYSVFKRRKGKVGRFTQYWVRSRETDLVVGIKPSAFYGAFEEFGSSKTRKHGILQSVVNENIPEIINIQSKYLSGLEDESRALSMISESEYGGGAEGE